MAFFKIFQRDANKNKNFCMVMKIILWAKLKITMIIRTS